MTLIIDSGFNYDPDASAYIDAVEAADTQALETATRYAINDFVIGCKQDGIWTAIKASCILAGARTLSGALVPLVGTAPTNFNFVAGDYNRKTGLVGDGSTKYLSSNRNNNADPQNNQHMSVYQTTLTTTTTIYIGAGIGSTEPGVSNFGRSGSIFFSRSRNNVNTSTTPLAIGFAGIGRSNGSAYTERQAGTSLIILQASSTPYDGDIGVFAGTAGSYKSNGRQAFYSIGESLDLALLDARVTALITAIGVAIP